MPQWGRPPGVWQGTQGRRRATQWEDFDGVRFEEIDSDNGDGYNGVAFMDSSSRRVRWNGDTTGRAGPREARLRNNGYDYESEVSDGVDYDLDDDADSTVAYAVQLAMRDKEEMLVEKALERIRRAQMLGKKNVRLSPEELDALERRRKGTGTGSKKITVPTTIGSAARSRASSISDKRPKSKDSFSKSSPRSASEWRQGLQEQYFVNEPSGTPKRPTSGVSPTNTSSRPRTPTTQSLRPQASNGSPLIYQSGYSQQRFLSERELPFVRPLPDDPQWVPRQRSLSNALPYFYDNSILLQQQYGAGNLDSRPSSFQGRRYAPEMSPLSTNYPLASQNYSRREAADVDGRRIPLESSEDESSNDSESDNDDDDDDNNADEGVQVKAVASPSAVPANAPRPATAGGRGSRGSRATRRRRGR